jgi:hypothetical protein
MRVLENTANSRTRGLQPYEPKASDNTRRKKAIPRVYGIERARFRCLVLSEENYPNIKRYTDPCFSLALGGQSRLYPGHSVTHIEQSLLEAFVCGPFQPSIMIADSNAHPRPMSYADVTPDTSSCVHKGLFFFFPSSTFSDCNTIWLRVSYLSSNFWRWISKAKSLICVSATASTRQFWTIRFSAVSNITTEIRSSTEARSCLTCSPFSFYSHHIPSISSVRHRSPTQ